MNKIIVLISLTLIACQPRQAQMLVDDAPTVSSLEEVSVEQTTSSKYLISADGIGRAKLGMTLGKLKKIADRDTKFELVSTFAPEYLALAAIQHGLTQYYILFEANTAGKSELQDDALIKSLITNNYNYQTEEGIKVGMLIAEAEDICGNAVLAYNTNGESAEYISFDDYELDNVRFRASYFKLISDGLGFSGIYPEYPGVAYITDKYREDAAIAAIEVSCKQDTCIK